MRKKIYIINNGLKDLRGHYFETAVSIAEASRALGLRPLLAAHVTCPSDIIPDGLDFHPVFTTDHWVCQPPLPQPELRDLRGELAPLRANSIVALRDGTIDFEQYLKARFIIDEAIQEGCVYSPARPVGAPCRPTGRLTLPEGADQAGGPGLPASRRRGVGAPREDDRSGRPCHPSSGIAFEGS